MTDKNNINTTTPSLLPDPALLNENAAKKLKPSKEFSTRIINHHTKIRLLATTAVENSKEKKNSDESEKAISSEEVAWQTMKQDKQALEQYSKDMFELATKYWKHGGGDDNEDEKNEAANCEDEEESSSDEDDDEQNNNNSSKNVKTTSGTAPKLKKRFMSEEQKKTLQRNSDRLLYIVESIELYFIGKSATTSASSESIGTIRPRSEQSSSASTTTPNLLLPWIVANPLKEFKRNSWKNLQRAATEQECDDFVQNYVRTELVGQGLLFDDDGDDKVKNSSLLTIVDIGSCYNPLRKVYLDMMKNKTMMENKFYSLDPVCVGLDLHPYDSRKSGVIQCDWHDVTKAEEGADKNFHKNEFHLQEHQGKTSDEEESIMNNEHYE